VNKIIIHLRVAAYEQSNVVGERFLADDSFFFTERVGPYPQAQLYWAGRTMGWVAD